MLRRLLIALVFTAAPAVATAELSVTIGYLSVDVPAPPVLSNLDPVPGDLAVAGARLAIVDNQTTGRFLGQEYTLVEFEPDLGSDILAAAREALAESQFLVLDVPAPTLLAIADLPEARSALLINATAVDSDLRDADCRSNLLHSLPSEAMRADALAQFLVQRRLTDVALIAGTYTADIAFADALRRALTKFQLRLRVEKTWEFDADMRRNAAQEVPLFTQELGEYELLLVADEIGDFGRYVAYNTWLPRPVAGSEGLRPVAWSGVVEQWGAAQLQSRFETAAGRKMRSADYGAWAAIRALGEAVTRTGSDDPAELRAYLLSDAFELAGFKGRPLSFRSWNGQLRQPIPLVTERAVVAVAPLEGFLHQHNEMDTLGLDAPESACKAFEEN